MLSFHLEFLFDIYWKSLDLFTQSGSFFCIISQIHTLNGNLRWLRCLLKFLHVQNLTSESDSRISWPRIVVTDCTHRILPCAIKNRVVQHFLKDDFATVSGSFFLVTVVDASTFLISQEFTESC